MDSSSERSVPPAWVQPFWDPWLARQRLTLAEEGAFLRYLERPGMPRPTTHADLDAAYQAFCQRVSTDA
jgi:hypothetical protein